MVDYLRRHLMNVDYTTVFDDTSVLCFHLMVCLGCHKILVFEKRSASRPVSIISACLLYFEWCLQLDLSMSY